MGGGPAAWWIWKEIAAKERYQKGKSKQRRPSAERSEWKEKKETVYGLRMLCRRRLSSQQYMQ